MNPKWFGDSYDIVKRYLIDNLKNIEYRVFADPMSTNDWKDDIEKYYLFIGASPLPAEGPDSKALFIDPDTGISNKKSNQHISMNSLMGKLEEFEIVFAFDQSFSYVGDQAGKMKEKLSQIAKTGNFGFYYNSHAKFLFCCASQAKLENVVKQLLSTGLPEERILKTRNFT